MRIVSHLFASAFIGILCGISSAVFLSLLEKITSIREMSPLLIGFLPLGGLIVGLLYQAYGQNVQAGHSLILDEFHEPKKMIALRMAPLVFIGTLITHLFGGSAGREGTAVQMGAALADQTQRFLKPNDQRRRSLLLAGMSGGFGSVFGVPWAGMIFGLEVPKRGRLQWRSAFECAIASFLGDHVTRQLGILHPHYPRPEIPSLNFKALFFSVVAGVCFGLAARGFVALAHGFEHLFKTKVRTSFLRPALGGALVALFYFILQTNRYAGLSLGPLIQAMHEPSLIYDWAAKLFATALTVGSGFKGGEVTPLLFVGTTLGNALHLVIPLPLSALAAMGFVAVFAGAANTPLACIVMAAELFGPGLSIFVSLACFASYAVSGSQGIYKNHRIDK